MSDLITTPPADLDPIFDLEKVYDEEVSPLMKQVIAICKRNGIPMIAQFAYAKGRKDNEGGYEAVTTSIPRGKWQPKEHQQALRILGK